MDIRWLRTFIITVKYENFRKASEELFLTQPAITKYIKRLVLKRVNDIYFLENSFL
jgi:LysR family transcriptional regulator, repressor for citA